MRRLSPVSTSPGVNEPQPYETESRNNKNRPDFSGRLSPDDPERRWLDVALDALTLDAGRAYVEALGGAIDDCANTLNIGVPTTVGSHVGVRNALPEPGSLATDVALRSHGRISDSRLLTLKCRDQCTREYSARSRSPLK